MSDINLALTAAGQALKAKIEKGDGKLPLNITRIVTASGKSDDPLNLVTVVNKEQEFVIIDRQTTGVRTSITAILTNTGNPSNGEQSLEKGYIMSQIGFYAEDPDDGEILYRISQFDMPNYVPAAIERGWKYNPTFNFISGNASVVNIDIVYTYDGREIGYCNSKSGILAENVQDAIDEMVLMHPVNCVINHRLGTYPSATVFEIRYGSGMGGCGETPCGGDEQYAEIKSRMIYMDSNNMRLSLEKQYIGTPMITQINEGVYILMFSDAAVRVSLHMDYVTQNIMMTKKLEALNNGLYNALTELSKSISNNKSNIDSNISGLNAAITALSATVVSNKKTTDGSISSLNTSIATLLTTVNNNKISADNSLKTLSDNVVDNTLAITTVNSNLLVKIDNVPIGCGN